MQCSTTLSFEQILDKINETLKDLIQESPSKAHAALFQAARYSMLSSGKRLRPLLTIVTAEMFGVSVETALLPAAAIEMIHTYSLIHDDLPCMDNDDLRRGKPTLHKVYGEAFALLTGDFLLTHAFEVVGKCPGVSDTQKVEMILSLSRHAGADGMIGGQLVDLSFEGKVIDENTLYFIHLNKTAALITASLEIGGILGCAHTSDKELLSQAGRDLGLAFQIVDDILDAKTDKEKPSAVHLFGLKSAKEKAQQHFLSAIKALQALSKDSSSLQALAKKLVEREN